MPKYNLLTQYKGQITPAQAAEGIRLAVQNANDLLADAKLLLENEHWPRACALAILAIEEAGKPQLIRRLLLARNGDELRVSWHEYRSHVNKNVMWIIPKLVSDGARYMEDFRPLFNENSDHSSLLETVKQISLYSDSCGNCHWSLPFDVIDQNLAENLVSIAQLLVQSQPSAISTEAELQLWVKHMRPVWKQSNEEMKTALLACYSEAEEKGVLSGKNTTNDIERFLEFE